MIIYCTASRSEKILVKLYFFPFTDWAFAPGRTLQAALFDLELDPRGPEKDPSGLRFSCTLFMRICSTLTGLVLISASSLAYGANPILYYEPAMVELFGVLEQQTFPGRPGYESLKNGDEIEKGGI